MALKFKKIENVYTAQGKIGTLYEIYYDHNVRSWTLQMTQGFDEKTEYYIRLADAKIMAQQAEDDIAITVWNVTDFDLVHHEAGQQALMWLFEAARCELGGDYDGAESAINTAARRFNYPGNLYLEVTKIKYANLFDDMRHHGRTTGREYQAWQIVRRVIARRQPIGAPVRLYNFDGTIKPEVYWITGTCSSAATSSTAIIRPATYQPIAEIDPVWVDLADLRPAYDQPMRSY